MAAMHTVTLDLDTEDAQRKLETLGSYLPQVQELIKAVEALGRALRDLPPIPSVKSAD